MDKYPSLTDDKSIQAVKHDIVYYIDTAGQKPVYWKPWPLSHEARGMAQAAFQKLVKESIIIRAHSGWCSPLHFVLKPYKSGAEDKHLFLWQHSTTDSWMLSQKRIFILCPWFRISLHAKINISYRIIFSQVQLSY